MICHYKTLAYWKKDGFTLFYIYIDFVYILCWRLKVVKRFWAKQWRSADLGCLYMHTSAACPFQVPFRDTLLPLGNRNLKWQGKRLLFFSVSFMQVQCLRQNSKHLFLFFMANKLLHRNLQSLFTELIRNCISESHCIELYHYQFKLLSGFEIKAQNTQRLLQLQDYRCQTSWFFLIVMVALSRVFQDLNEIAFGHDTWLLSCNPVT